MVGRRVYPDADGNIAYAEGDYGKMPNGVWYARPPGSHLGSLANHEVTEHEDGTISVQPSILIDAPGLPSWHGFLEKGCWRSC